MYELAASSSNNIFLIKSKQIRAAAATYSEKRNAAADDDGWLAKSSVADVPSCLHSMFVLVPTYVRSCE